MLQNNSSSNCGYVMYGMGEYCERRKEGNKGSQQKGTSPDVSTTRPDTRHKMRLVCVFFTFQNNTGQTDGRTDLRTDGHDLLQSCDGASKNQTETGIERQTMSGNEIKKVE